MRRTQFTMLRRWRWMTSKTSDMGMSRLNPSERMFSMGFMLRSTSRPRECQYLRHPCAIT